MTPTVAGRTRRHGDLGLGIGIGIGIGIDVVGEDQLESSSEFLNPTRSNPPGPANR